VSTYELLAELPLVVEGYEFEGHEVAFSGEFVRKTTVIKLRGSGVEGLGEDVTYAGEDQEALQRAGAGRWPLAGAWTLASFAEHLRSLDLFPQPTDRPEFRLYRNWAFDSAALDLAWTAAGRYDAYFERTVKPWDIAAGTLVCERAGLSVVELPELEGLPFGVMAAAPTLVEPLLQLIG